MFGARVAEQLQHAGLDVAAKTVQAGEEQKSLSQAGELYDWLLEVGIRRDDYLIALGGGVVGDLVGFVAATILRGVRFVQIPTTLLAMVDSSVGGKVAVNHRLGKNMIGAFHQPALVVADTAHLDTLPRRELRAGWAEVVKIAMIMDAPLFHDLEEHAEPLAELADPIAVTRAVSRAIELKAEVVGEDEREDGRRVILNYGHTIGHAIEAATDYGTYLHGEAVAIGMRGAGWMASRRGLLADAAYEAQTRLLQRMGLPQSVRGVRAASLFAPLSRDKKARGSSLQWIFADAVGSVTSRRDVTADELAGALAEIGCE
jgi:3-dehydroquinate synthase